MTRTFLRCLALVLVSPLIVGCAGDPSRTEGGCNARIAWDTVVYRPHTGLNQAAPRGEPLGNGDVLGCDGKSNPSLGTATVFAIDGVDPSLAIRTGNGEWQGVYVAEGVPQSSWPPVLRVR